MKERPACRQAKQTHHSAFARGKCNKLPEFLDFTLFWKTMCVVNKKFRLCFGQSTLQVRSLIVLIIIRWSACVSFPFAQILTRGKGKQGLIIDYALPKNHKGILELPDDFPVEMRCLCSHFGCNVYHETQLPKANRPFDLLGPITLVSFCSCPKGDHLNIAGSFVWGPVRRA